MKQRPTVRTGGSGSGRSFGHIKGTRRSKPLEGRRGIGSTIIPKRGLGVREEDSTFPFLHLKL